MIAGSCAARIRPLRTLTTFQARKSSPKLATCSVFEQRTGQVAIRGVSDGHGETRLQSTLSAEASGLVAAMEAADYLRSVILAIVCPTMSLGEFMRSEKKLLVQVYTDAKSVYDVVVKDTSRPGDKRLGVVVAQLREMCSVTGTELKWIDNSMMLADCLTKVGAERGCLLMVVTTSTWFDQITEDAMKIKEKIQQGRHGCAGVARQAKRQKKDEDANDEH